MLEQPLLDLATLDRPGDIIAGKYRLDHVLGQGGMGTVWRASNLALDSPVAIKVLSSAVDSSALRERLLVEARAAAKLTHPAIVKVFDVDETERGAPFIVMELLNGTSLGALLARDGRLPAARAVQLLLPIVDALRLAHDKGLVHRDVKPDNVFIVDDDGSTQPKLVDFGIVKVEREPGDSSLTRAGDVMGSPDYMSPEQARGEGEITFASDIGALSVVLYEAIAGRPPFSAPNYNALLWKILEAKPTTLTELGVADDALSAIVARGLSKQAAARFSSMRELGLALAEWLLNQGARRMLAAPRSKASGRPKAACTKTIAVPEAALSGRQSRHRACVPSPLHRRRRHPQTPFLARQAPPLVGGLPSAVPWA